MNYAQFKPAFEHAKLQAQIKKLQTLRNQRAAAGLPVTAADIAMGAELTTAEALRAAKGPWEEAFSVENNLRGWREEGIVPFTCKLAWDLLAVEQARGQVVAPDCFDGAAAPSAFRCGAGCGSRARELCDGASWLPS